MRTIASIHKWQDWASFALGLGLAVSPWIVGYSEHHGATANAVFVGLALAMVSHFEAALDVSAEWLNLAAGLWLLAAPFVLGFPAASMAMVIATIIGALIVFLAISALSLDKGVGNWWHKQRLVKAAIPASSRATSSRR